MRMCGDTANFGEGVAAFRQEVAAEVACEEEMLQKLQEPRTNEKYGHLASFFLTSLVIVLIFFQNSVFILWLIIAILLYSYNFVIMLIPTTTERIRPDDKELAPVIDRERKWLALRLLLKKKKLAIEIGLTVLLGGLVPLSLGFSIIFGLAMFFAIYLGFLAHVIAGQAVLLIVVQIAFIILFYVLMLLIEPQAQGITKIAISFKRHFDDARSKGRKAYFVIVLAMIGVITVAGVLVIGAMLLPGLILPSFFADLNMFPNVDLPLIAIVFVSQLVIMRHFQGIMSRWMAVNLLNTRLEDLHTDVLDKLDVLEDMPENEDKGARLKDLKKKYYSIAIYDVIRQDLFGYSPVYLVGPRLRYVLDEGVIEHF
ncbi:MAG TPA: hypothetical protein VGK23_11445 [Methanomassiliicoccales archaeon]|jgi:hypothetical protein